MWREQGSESRRYVDPIILSRKRESKYKTPSPRLSRVAVVADRMFFSRTLSRTLLLGATILKDKLGVAKGCGTCVESQHPGEGGRGQPRPEQDPRRAHFPVCAPHPAICPRSSPALPSQPVPPQGAGLRQHGVRRQE